jgi:hypothetical protein
MEEKNLINATYRRKSSEFKAVTTQVNQFPGDYKGSWVISSATLLL